MRWKGSKGLKMRNDNKAENQHYVPKMLLRSFSFSKGKGEYLHAYDKHLERTFTPELKNIAAERGFYDLKSEDLEGVSLEPVFTSLEGFTAKAFAKLVAARNLAVLDSQDKTWIGIFAATQHLRTKNFRRMTSEIDARVRQKISDLGGDIDNVENYVPFKGEEDVKTFANYFMVSNLREFSNLMMIKHWSLYETTLENPFVIGDHPVVLHNNIDMGPYGNLGLALKGIQIYLPLSPTLTLGLLCPSIIKEMAEKVEWAKTTYDQQNALRTLAPAKANTELINRLKESLADLEPVMFAFTNGTPGMCSKENMDFFNSLQIQWAERFVMSTNNNFELVERMIKDNPKFKTGVGIKM
jgi:hypothetical protein